MRINRRLLCLVTCVFLVTPASAAVIISYENQGIVLSAAIAHRHRPFRSVRPDGAWYRHLDVGPHAWTLGLYFLSSRSARRSR